MNTGRSHLSVFMLGIFLAISVAGLFTGDGGSNYNDKAVQFILSASAEDGDDHLLFLHWDNEEITGNTADDFYLNSLTGFHSVIAKVKLDSQEQIRISNITIRDLYLLNSLLLI